MLNAQIGRADIFAAGRLRGGDTEERQLGEEETAGRDSCLKKGIISPGLAFAR
jgi:hypothetical protein